VKFFYILHGYR